jgi:hypothetical protein
VYLIIIGILTILLNRLEQALVIPGMDVAKRGG